MYQPIPLDDVITFYTVPIVETLTKKVLWLLLLDLVDAKQKFSDNK